MSSGLLPSLPEPVKEASMPFTKDTGTVNRRVEPDSRQSMCRTLFENVVLPSTTTLSSNVSIFVPNSLIAPIVAKMSCE